MHQTRNQTHMLNRVPEELVERVGVVECGLPVVCQRADLLVPLVDELPLAVDPVLLEVLALHQRVGLLVHLFDSLVVGCDVRFHHLCRFCHQSSLSSQAILKLTDL